MKRTPAQGQRSFMMHKRKPSPLKQDRWSCCKHHGTSYERKLHGESYWSMFLTPFVFCPKVFSVFPFTVRFVHWKLKKAKWLYTHVSDAWGLQTNPAALDDPGTRVGCFVLSSLKLSEEAPYLRKSSSVRLVSGTFWLSQVRKWNWVTVRVSLVCMFFK